MRSWGRRRPDGSGRGGNPPPRCAPSGTPSRNGPMASWNRSCRKGWRREVSRTRCAGIRRAAPGGQSPRRAGVALDRVPACGKLIPLSFCFSHQSSPMDNENLAYRHPAEREVSHTRVRLCLLNGRFRRNRRRRGGSRRRQIACARRPRSDRSRGRRRDRDPPRARATAK